MNVAFGFDYRSISLYRIGISLVILYDLYIRSLDMKDHYTDDGSWPRSIAILLQDSEIWSLHMYSGTLLSQIILFSIHTLFTCFLLIGYKCKSSVVVVWLMTISLQSRNEVVNNFGDQLLRCVLFWSMFLPLDKVWSYDAYYKLKNLEDYDCCFDLRRNGYQNKIESKSEWCVVNLSTICFHLQLCFVYLFTAILKDSDEWRGNNGDSSAIYYALQVDYYITEYGLLLRQLPITVLSNLTWMVLYFEFFAPFGLIAPWLYIKIVTVILLFILHMSLAMCFHLGIFTAIYSVLFLIFIPTECWDWFLAKFFHRNHKINIKIAKSSTRLFRWINEWALFNGYPSNCIQFLKEKQDFNIFLKVEKEYKNNNINNKNDNNVDNNYLNNSDNADNNNINNNDNVNNNNNITNNDNVNNNNITNNDNVDNNNITNNDNVDNSNNDNNDNIDNNNTIYYNEDGWTNLLKFGIFHNSYAFMDLKRLRINDSKSVKTFQIGKKLKKIIMILLLYYCICSNIESMKQYNVWWLPASLKSFGTSIRLRQDWSMFAPAPPRDDGWYVFVGQMNDGQIIDPFHNTTKIQWEKPNNVHKSFKSVRWLACLINLWTIMTVEPTPYHQADVMNTISSYLCLQHPNLSHLKIHYMREYTMPYPKKPRVENWKLWIYDC